MLNVKGLTVETPLLQLTNISFEVSKGEILVLVGPNGGGKSAILEKIADPQANYQGTVVANHFNSHGDKEKFQIQIGYLPQDFLPPLHLTGYEFLEIVGTSYRLANKSRATRIKKLAATLGCEKDIYNVMERVSSSTRQKIGIIAATLSEPPVVILDEPINFLDEESQQSAKKIIKDLADKGASILMSTNNLTFAEEMGDYFVLVRDGEVSASGTLAQLSHQAQTTKTLGLIYKNIITEG